MFWSNWKTGFFKPYTVEQKRAMLAEEVERDLFEAQAHLVKAQQIVEYQVKKLAFLKKGIKR